MSAKKKASKAPPRASRLPRGVNMVFSILVVGGLAVWLQYQAYRIFDKQSAAGPQGEAGEPAADVDLEEVAAKAREAMANSLCTDGSKDCPGWAESGECDANPSFMLSECRRSCGVCGGKGVAAGQPACEDKHAMCGTWASIGECDTNAPFMKAQCKVSCHLCQSASCRDTADDCAARAEGSGCYTGERMLDECAWTCGTCKLTNSSACARPMDAHAAGGPGGVKALFEGILSRPKVGHEGRGMVTVHSRDPWIITIDGFISGEEADALLKAGGHTWTRSLAGDGVQAARTSSTSWCTGACVEDAAVRRVQDRVDDLTGIPAEHAEFIQMLRYEPGQFYKRHHDQNSPRSSPWGPRLYTFYMYLSDVESGGQTAFPALNITVEPKKGRAILWTNVVDGDPYQRDDRTDHESIPVGSGVKFGSNVWLHLFPYRKISRNGCDNIPYINNWR